MRWQRGEDCSLSSEEPGALAAQVVEEPSFKSMRLLKRRETRGGIFEHKGVVRTLMSQCARRQRLMFGRNLCGTVAKNSVELPDVLMRCFRL